MKKRLFASNVGQNPQTITLLKESAPTSIELDVSVESDEELLESEMVTNELPSSEKQKIEKESTDNEEGIDKIELMEGITIQTSSRSRIEDNVMVEDLLDLDNMEWDDEEDIANWDTNMVTKEKESEHEEVLILEKDAMKEENREPKGNNTTEYTSIPSKERERLFKGYATELGILTLKPFQTRAIQAFTEKKDTLIVQATSSGKSVCFQVPSLMLESGKLFLVVSPTISLLESQVHSLRSHGIPAIYFSSSSELKVSHLEGMHESMSEDNPFPRLVYMTPEYLMGNRNNKKAGGAIQILFKFDESIGLIVIDECHKVFDRSGDFRYVLIFMLNKLMYQML
jgi:ATP-dependent DNA helicase RecQ